MLPFLSNLTLLWVEISGFCDLTPTGFLTGCQVTWFCLQRLTAHLLPTCVLSFDWSKIFSANTPTDSAWRVSLRNCYRDACNSLERTEETRVHSESTYLLQGLEIPILCSLCFSNDTVPLKLVITWGKEATLLIFALPRNVKEKLLDLECISFAGVLQDTTLRAVHNKS